MKPDDPNQAYIDDDGVLHDPTALAVIEAVERHNIRNTLDAFHGERVKHFMRRIAELGRSPADVMILIACVDDKLGAKVADQVMPGFDWDAIRARGQVPFARGLVERAGFQELLDRVDPERGRELRAIAGVALLVADRDLFHVMPALEVR